MEFCRVTFVYNFHAKRANTGSGNKAPYFLELGPIWRKVVSFTLLLICPQWSLTVAGLGPDRV